MKNCEIGGCADRGRETCPVCVHWTPSRSHKYYRCAQYLESRVTCDLPRSACATCPQFLPPEQGRPNLTGVDWSDPRERRAYYRERNARLRSLPMYDDTESES